MQETPHNYIKTETRKQLLRVGEQKVAFLIKEKIYRKHSFNPLEECLLVGMGAG